MHYMAKSRLHITQVTAVRDRKRGEMHLCQGVEGLRDQGGGVRGWGMKKREMVRKNEEWLKKCDSENKRNKRQRQKWGNKER